MVKSFNLTEEQIARVNEICDEERRTASAVVGMAIDYYYENRKVRL